jgi:effector-binding domain-containing protein
MFRIGEFSRLGQVTIDNQYQIIGPPRELFHGSSENGDLTAEIQFPVEKR